MTNFSDSLPATNELINSNLFAELAPLQLDYQLFLAQQIKTVFAVATDPCHLTACVQTLCHISVYHSGKGLIRRCDFGNDMIVDEEILLWQPPRAFVYSAVAPNPFGFRRHLAYASFTPHKDGTLLRWKHYFEHDDLAAVRSMMTTMFEQIFDSLLQQFDGYVFQ